MRLGQIIRAFLKVGVCGFGGGSALIPLVEDEAVERRGFLSHAAYGDIVIAASVTPGALPVKLAAACGQTAAHNAGMLAAAASFCFPGLAGLLILLNLFTALGDGPVCLLQQAAVGINAFIIYLLLAYIDRVHTDARHASVLTTARLNTGLAFLLISGDEIAELLQVLLGWDFYCPSISVTSLLILFLFLYFFLNGTYKSTRLPLTLAVAILYILPSLLGWSWPRWPLDLLMLLAVAWRLRRDLVRGGEPVSSGNNWREHLGGSLLLVWVVPLLLTLVAVWGHPLETLRFLWDGIRSTLFSFGGGEAYLSIADDIFVGGGYIDKALLYETLLPSANMLPGPILVKLLAGVGYYRGLELGGSALSLLWALLGASVGVAASLSLFFPLLRLCQHYSSLPLFEHLQLWILPVVCGMLLSTIVSLVSSALPVNTAAQLPVLAALALSLPLSYLARKRWRAPDLLLILVYGTVSILLCSRLPL